MMRCGLMVALLVLSGCVENAWKNCLAEGRCVNGNYASMTKRPVAGTPVHHLPVMLEWVSPNSPSEFKYNIQTAECGVGMNLIECLDPERKVAVDHGSDTTSLGVMDLPMPPGVPHSRRIAWRVRACPRDSNECGPWSEPSYFRLGHPGGPALGDIDKDGMADILVGDVAYGITAASGGVYVEGFDNVVPGVVGTPIGGSLALADFNGDGSLDALAANGSSAQMVAIAYGGLSVMPFENFTSVTSAASVVVARAGDVNGDGYEDVVLGGVASAPPLGLLYGAEFPDPSQAPVEMNVGGFSLPSPPSTPDAVERIAAPGDLNGDDYDDVVVVDDQNFVRIFFGGPSLNAPFSLRDPFPGARVAPAGDLDRDGFADFALIDGNRVTIQLGGPDLAAAHHFEWFAPVGWTILDAVGGDFWGEGRTQLAVSVTTGADNRLEMLELGPSGGPGSPLTVKGPTDVRIWPSSSGIGVHLLAAGDLDGNGQEDLVSPVIVPAPPPSIAARVLPFWDRAVNSERDYWPNFPTNQCCTIAGVR